MSRWSVGASALALGLAVAAACDSADAELPDGALARVGEVVIEPEMLSELNAELGAYGQARFRGEGQASLLESAINLELLAQEGERLGFAQDPRVEWAIVEDLAARELATQLNERVPYESVAGDASALRAAYDAQPDLFDDPELRGVSGVVYRQFFEAEDALARVLAGDRTLEEEAATRPDEVDQSLVETPRLPRNDVGYPGAHPMLFAADLEADAVVPVPLFFGRSVMIGSVIVDPPEHAGFDDPVVRERVVEHVRAPLLQAAQAELELELRERFPAEAPN